MEGFAISPHLKSLPSAERAPQLRATSERHLIVPDLSKSTEGVAPAAATTFAVLAVALARERRRPRSARLALVARQAEASSDPQQIFKEAYQAEAERAKLLVSQLEAVLSEQLGVAGGQASGIKIAVQAPDALPPLETEGTDWRKAYEDIKARTASLEAQLQKAKGLNAPPQPASPSSEQEIGVQPPQFDGKSQLRGQLLDRLDPMEQVQLLREVTAKAADEDAVLRLIALAALPNREVALLLEDDEAPAPEELPPIATAKEVLASEDFSIEDFSEFDRCYIFTGAVPEGREPSAALESMQSCMRALQAPGAKETELYLQPAKEDGKGLLIMLHSSDLPSDEVPSWQYGLCIFLFLLTCFAACSNTFLVVPAGASQIISSASDVATLRALLEKVLPAALGILATVAAQESARRAVALQYGVNLTPPFLLPTWPLGSLGCLGAVTRRLSSVPTREAEYNMSAAAVIAGLIVPIGLIAAGLAQGPEGYGVNLNYQLLPVAVKFILRPFLGTASASTQTDPFADPVETAFPVSPLLIGGVCGLIITALSLLPIGRLDGGVLARNALDKAAAPLGLLSFLVLFIGTFAPGDEGNLYLSFGLAAVFWQGGAEPPPKEAITSISGFQQVLAAVLLVLGFVLTIPGGVGL